MRSTRRIIVRRISQYRRMISEIQILFRIMLAPPPRSAPRRPYGFAILAMALQPGQAGAERGKCAAPGSGGGTEYALGPIAVRRYTSREKGWPRPCRTPDLAAVQQSHLTAAPWDVEASASGAGRHHVSHSAGCVKAQLEAGNPRRRDSES